MPKKDEKKPSEKEIYRLWWEYLKRSERYEVFCIFAREAAKIIKKAGGALTDVVEELILSESPPDTKIISLKNSGRYWEYFGDVFNDSFDDWWKQDKPAQNTLPVVVLNDPKACKALPFFAEEFRKRQKRRKRPLSPEETLRILAESEFGFIFLAVPMVGGVSMEEISRQIVDIRKQWAKEFDVEDLNFRRCKMPVSRVRYDELKRYLMVYDLKQQGLKMKDIIAKIDPERRGNDADVLRTFRSDLKKAKQVISNVEYGIFPDYPPDV